MKTKSALGITACLAALSTFAIAQSDPPSADSESSPPRRHHERPAHHPADSNDDGIVTSDEFQKYHQEIFSKSDENKDGQLDREEVLSIREHMGGRPGAIPPAPGPEWRSGKGDRKHRGHRNPEEIFGTLDLNEDGRLQESELPEGMAQHFERLDADSDGSITLEELEQGRPDPEEMKARFQERFKAMDKNEDGMIQKDEAEGPMERHFDRMDSNGDGTIDADELKAMREKIRSGSDGDRPRHRGRRPGAEGEGRPPAPDDPPSESPEP